MKKITLYLPVEFKARELSSFILLSKYAVEQGCRVYIGSKSAINRLLKVKKSVAGLFVFKGGLETKDIINIRKKINRFVILDQELSPSCLDFHHGIRSRMWPGSEEYIDRYYLIGDNAYKAGLKVLSKISSRIIKSGWPSIDLLRSDFKKLYVDQVKKISDRYGDFILFSSAFGYNSKKKINDIYEANKNHKWESVRNDLKDEMQWAELTLNEFHNNIKVLREIDKDKSCPQIIIRPHPAEDHSEWEKISKTFDNIKVIFEGEITPWVYAAKAMLHRGCATSVNAYMAGLAVGYPIFTKKTIKKALPYEISEHLFSKKDIINFCKKNINNKPQHLKKYSKAFNKMIHIEKKPSSKIIIDDMLKLKIEKETYYQTGIMDSIHDILKECSQHIKIFVNKRPFFNNSIAIAPQTQKMPGGITKNEISNMLRKLSTHQNYKVKKVFRDCVEIE